MNEATEQKKKNDSIENSPEKNKVRQDIIMQFKKCMMYQKIKNARLLTLPAKKAYFETALVHSFKRDEVPVNLDFIGVEMDMEIAPETFKNMPANSMVAGNCTIEDFLKYEHQATKSGAIGLTNVERTSPLLFDLIWLDYCGWVTEESMNHFVKCILENVKQGYIAVTWDLSTRHMKPEEYAKTFKGYKKGMSLREAIIATIELKLKAISKVVSLVYNVEYGGGDIGRTTMLTLGYSVNIPKKVVTPIEENFRDGKAEVKMARAGMIHKFKKTGKWEVGFKDSPVRVAKVKGSVGRPKLYANAEERRIILAVAKWAKKWKAIKNRTKKVNIAKRYGMTINQFASKVAWHHMPTSKVA